MHSFAKINRCYIFNVIKGFNLLYIFSVTFSEQEEGSLNGLCTLIENIPEVFILWLKNKRKKSDKFYLP